MYVRWIVLLGLLVGLGSPAWAAEVLYSSAGVCGSEAAFDYEPTTNTLTVGIVDITQGTTGQCLRMKEGSGNGTNKIDSCAPDALTGDASFTRETGTGRIEVAEQKDIWCTDAFIDDPNSYDTSSDGGAQFKFTGEGLILTSVTCSTKTATAVLQLDERVVTTPNTTGTSMISGTCTCDTNSESCTLVADPTPGDGAPVAIVLSSASTADDLRIHVCGTH